MVTKDTVVFIQSILLDTGKKSKSLYIFKLFKEMNSLPFCKALSSTMYTLAPEHTVKTARNRVKATWKINLI